MKNNDYTPRTPDALPPGHRFDEFEIQDVIDSNNTGIVYRAWDHQLERPVVIREFMPRALTVRSDNLRLVLRSKKDKLAFNAGLNRFVAEARQLAHFNHPNLLQVLRFWTLNETAYTAMLFYSGISLAELHQQQPEIINEAWLRHMLPMLCGALAALHEGGCLHRDLSLKSIQIQDNGTPLLLDFAASRSNPGGISSESKTSLQAGYAPLEQYTVDLEDQLGPWTDIYALGAVLYTLITHTCPPASVTRSIQDGCEPLAERHLEGYPRGLLLAIDCALSLKPEDRPQSITEFAALADIPLGDTGDLTSTKKPGTMLIPIEPVGSSEVFPFWKRYKSLIQIAAGVAIGIVIGALMFGRTTVQEEIPATKTAMTKTGMETSAANTMTSRLYIKMDEAEHLAVNGKMQMDIPTSNGYGSLELPPGKYTLTLSGKNRSRTVTLSVAKPGTWLVNPQG